MNSPQQNHEPPIRLLRELKDAGSEYLGCLAMADASLPEDEHRAAAWALELENRIDECRHLFKFNDEGEPVGIADGYQMKAIPLSEDVLINSIQGWLMSADADEIAAIAERMFGGKCVALGDEAYEFTPDENYYGSFGDPDIVPITEPAQSDAG